MNRELIKKALREYEEIQKTFELLKQKINNDEEITQLKNNRETRKDVYYVLNAKYPQRIRVYKELDDKAINLISVMVNDIEEYKDIDPVDIYLNKSTFNKLVALAKEL